MGPLSISSASVIDFAGTSSTLTFSSLTINNTLACRNYTPDATLAILVRTATGNLSNHQVLQRLNGSTSLRTGAISMAITSLPFRSQRPLLCFWELSGAAVCLRGRTRVRKWADERDRASLFSRG